MTKTKNLSASLKETLNGYGIVRCEEKKVDFDGNTYGQTHVWYDVCVDNGEGDIVDSFKTLAAARKYAREN